MQFKMIQVTDETHAKGKEMANLKDMKFRQYIKMLIDDDVKRYKKSTKSNKIDIAV